MRRKHMKRLANPKVRMARNRMLLKENKYDRKRISGEGTTDGK